MIQKEDKGPLNFISAKSLDEAKQELHEKYGNRYEIVNIAPDLRGGFLGIGQKELVKVTYTVSDKSSSSRYAASSDSFLQSRNELTQFGEKMLGKSLAPEQTPSYMRELGDLSRKLDELTKEVKKGNSSTAEQPATITKIQELLSVNEFSFSYIQKISDRIKATFPLEQVEDFELVERTVVEWIGEDISIAQKKVHRKPHVFIVVGPTGVGKTTTLVKLATQYVLDAKKEGRTVNLCFVNTDTMRVGAMAQLERYSDMFGVQIQKAENADDVRRIYDDVKDHVDAIFIDTSGYSPNDATHIGMMKATLDVPGLNPDVYLVVCASTKARDLENIMQNYEPFGYKSVIITKCDESGQFGNVLSALNEKNKSVSYVTDGQKVTACIQPASRIYFLIRLAEFRVDRIRIEDKFGEN